jgi:hypothetical protein
MVGVPLANWKTSRNCSQGMQRGALLTRLAALEHAQMFRASSNRFTRVISGSRKPPDDSVLHALHSMAFFLLRGL